MKIKIGKFFKYQIVGTYKVLGRERSVFYNVLCLICNRERIVSAKTLYRQKYRVYKYSQCRCESASKISKINTKHGQSDRTSLYIRWSCMKSRCYLPKHVGYKNYGGRGIKVCERWKHSFVSFAKDMGPTFKEELWLDRIDNNKDYSPENCRWVTTKEQSKNKRPRTFYSVDGITRSLDEWTKYTDVPRKRIYERIHNDGWTPKRAIFTKLKKYEARLLHR